MSPTTEFFYKLRDTLEDGAHISAVNELLRESLFYYCSGKDPTPIAAFGSDIPLYVYSDLFKYMRINFEEATRALYEKITSLGYYLSKTQSLSTLKITPSITKAELSHWKSNDNKYFILLYTQSDAEQCYKKLYSPEEELRPKYFCNYRYEIPHRGVLETEEKLAEYVMGHCHSERFTKIAEYGYLGDYSFGASTKVPLYRNSLIYDI